MEKINTEILVSSLFAIGFDKVDALLYTYTLGQLSIDNQQLQLFEFEDEETHQIFNKYVDYDGIIFKLKDGITLDTMTSYNDEKFYPLRKMLNTNSRLIEYLSGLDFRKIIIKKIEALGVDRLDSFDLLFSNHEKEIMYKMFGIENMHRENANKQSEVYSQLYDQESRDIDIMLSGLGTNETKRDIKTESVETEEIIADIQKGKKKRGC